MINQFHARRARLFGAVVFMVAMVTLPSIASSQVRFGVGGNRPVYFGSGYHYGGWNYGYGGYYPGAIGWGATWNGEAATATSANLRGLAALTEAQGQAAKDRAAAAKDYEVARKTYLENRQIHLQELADRREQNDKKRAEREAANRERAMAWQKKQKQSPVSKPRLTDAEFDRKTGEIHWPKALQAAAYSVDRTRMEALLVARAQAAATDLDADLLIVVKSLRSKLQANITEMPAYEYIESRKFLEGLATEMTG